VDFMSNVANLIGRGCCSSRKAYRQKREIGTRPRDFFSGQEEENAGGAAKGVPQEGTVGGHHIELLRGQ
jgi:hypothetical protein